MTLTISEDRMTSDITRHEAQRAAAEEQCWTVSWWPARRLDRNQAISALTLAEFVEQGRADHPLVGELASELDVPVTDAVTAVRRGR